MMALRAVLASRSTTPLSFMMLPKKKGPSRGMEAGAMKVQRIRPTTGKITSSLRDTWRISGMRMRISFLVTRSRMIGGWMIGMSAM